eukprot:5163678-Amphidinium_carterae.1
MFAWILIGGDWQMEPWQPQALGWLEANGLALCTSGMPTVSGVAEPSEWHSWFAFGPDSTAFRGSLDFAGKNPGVGRSFLCTCLWGQLRGAMAQLVTAGRAMVSILGGHGGTTAPSA